MTPTHVPAPAVKSGWRTTEFWMMAAVNAAALLSALAGALPPKWAAIAAAVSSGLYAVGRGQAKRPV